jgi:hypothetical protein
VATAVMRMFSSEKSMRVVLRQFKHTVSGDNKLTSWLHVSLQRQSIAVVGGKWKKAHSINNMKSSKYPQLKQPCKF